MNNLFVCCLLFVVSSFVLAQSREEKLEQLRSRDDVTVTEIEKDILKLEYLSGKVLYKNIGDYGLRTKDEMTYSPTFDSTIIDLRYVDTTLYSDKYVFWQEVPFGNLDPLPVADINQNQIPEIYARHKDYTEEYSEVNAYEMDQNGNYYSIHQYDTTSRPVGFYDINKNGDKEFFIRSWSDYFGNIYQFFKKPSQDSLAIQEYFEFKPFDIRYQQNDTRFGDWDNDLLTDQVFFIDGKFNVFEFNPTIPEFDSVYQYDYYPLDIYYGGFSIGDFDQDTNAEFLAGSIHGKVLSIENNGNDSYAPNWQGMVETYNAYLCTETNDIDNNGKKEIWIGGDAYYNGIGTTRITIFESSSDNDYKIVGRIDLVGVFSFYAGNIQPVDVDKDGTEEIMICIDQNVLILKFNGSENHQTYELFYIKQNELALSGHNSVYYGATMYDLIDDEKEEIVINMDDVKQNVGLKLFSYLLKPDFTVGIDEIYEMLPDKFQLYQNFPNPFNSQTKIEFVIPQISDVSAKVYNILGKEVTTLANKDYSPGIYSVSWDGRGSKGELLPSGVYLIKFTATGGAGTYTKTIKAIMLK